MAEQLKRIKNIEKLSPKVQEIYVDDKHYITIESGIAAEKEQLISQQAVQVFVQNIEKAQKMNNKEEAAKQVSIAIQGLHDIFEVVNIE